MANETILQETPKEPDELSPAQKRDVSIYKRVAEGDYKAILEGVPRAFRPDVAENLNRLGKIMDVLGPGADKGILLREAQTSAAFPYLLGSELHRELMAGYQQIAPLWRDFCQVGTFKDFRTHYIIREGEMAAIEQVKEAAEYPEVTFTEKRPYYACNKYGSTFSLSFEALTNDDLNEFANIPRKLGQAVTRFLNKTATELITANAATTYDSVTLMHASSHGANLSSASLAEAELGTGIRIMAAQVDPDSNVIVVEPETLMVPPALTITAKRIALSTIALSGNTTPAGNLNVVGSYGLKVLQNPWIATTTDFFLLANPNINPVVRIGFLNGQQEPELFRAAVGNPLDFNRDIQQWKVRICFNVIAVDHVGIYGRT